MDSARSSVYREGYKTTNAELSKPLITEGDLGYSRVDSEASASSSDDDEFSTDPMLVVYKRQLRREFQKGTLYLVLAALFVAAFISVVHFWPNYSHGDDLTSVIFLSGITVLLISTIRIQERKWDRVVMQRNSVWIALIVVLVGGFVGILDLSAAIGTPSFVFEFSLVTPLVVLLSGTFFLKEKNDILYFIGFLLTFVGILLFNDVGFGFLDNYQIAADVNLAGILGLTCSMIKLSKRVYWVGVAMAISGAMIFASSLLLWSKFTDIDFHNTEVFYHLSAGVSLGFTILFSLKALQKLDLTLCASLFCFCLLIPAILQLIASWGSLREIGSVVLSFAGFTLFCQRKYRQIQQELSESKLL